MIVTVVCRHESQACTGRRGLEARCLRDHIVRQDAAVGPATHAQAIRVDESDPDAVIDRRHHVRKILLSPRGDRTLGKLFAITGRSPGIGHDDRIAVGRE